LKGLYEFGTRRIKGNNSPFPFILRPFVPPHAPLIPCNHKCGITGTLSLWKDSYPYWKRIFVVHTHHNH
jgi:hypothetical protein